MVHAGLTSEEREDNQSQRIFQKPGNFMVNGAGMNTYISEKYATS